MVELSRLCRQTSFDVAKTFSPSYLCKSHHAKLLGARQCTYPRIPVVTRNNPSEACPRYEVHDLREQRLADIHGSFSGLGTRKHRENQPSRSSRNQIEMDLRCCYAMLFSHKTLVLTGRQCPNG